MSSDRMVHAYTDHWEICRYDVAGRWYIEWVGPEGQAPTFVLPGAAQNALRLNKQGRTAVTVGMAAWVASKLEAAVFFDRPGGRTFDARIQEHRERSQWPSRG